MIKHKTKRTEIKPTINQSDIQLSNNPSILSNIIQGFTFGTGSALAHKAVSAVSTVFDNKENQEEKKDCKALLETFQNCTQNNDYETCKHIFQEFTKCSK